MKEITKIDIYSTLDEKIEQSKKVIKETLIRFSNEQICIAWTGGKDSTTLLWLYRLVCEELGKPMPMAMFIDDGYVFEEIVNLLNLVKGKWNLPLTKVKNTDLFDKAKNIGDLVKIADLDRNNRSEIKKIGYTDDTFVFDPESYVCNHLLKTVPMNFFIAKNNVEAVSTAIRWDEQKARTTENYFSERKNPDHIRVHPILHFKERDIWDTIHNWKIPFCSLYRQGYRSLGAKGSTTKFSDIPAWEQDMENTSERAGRAQDKEEIMEQLRSLGYM